ncbi:MAG TPA: MBL fold metallo-hydrolase [Thermoleophilaceae bacterium]|nr:MBL fold metallo-hydrolase [Thermoleophilaceae bacterium]
MKQLADGVWQLAGFPPNAINVYLVGDVLVDAATRRAGRRILRQLTGRDVRAHALTHAHPDHQGASHEVCERLGIPLWCGTNDADAAERPELIVERQPTSALNRLIWRSWAGPGHPVERRLQEGDDVAGFTVLDTPGHSAGHIVLWRETDRVLIAGDVLNGMNLITAVPGLHEPPVRFTPDPARNRESIRRVAALEPALVCFGHGPPLRDPRKLSEFAARLR